MAPADGLRDLGRAAAIIAGKDIRSEFRRYHEIFSLLAFAAGSMLIAGLAAPGAGGATAVVVLWITLLFVTILIFTTSFSREADQGTLGGLKTLPCSPMAVLGGKVIYGTIILMSTGLVLVPFASVFMGLGVAGELPGFLAVYLLGVLGLSFAGSFVSGLVMFSEEKTMLLSLLLLPVCVPVVVPAVTATGKIASGAGLPEVMAELRLIGAFLLVISAIMILTFSFILEE